MADCFAIRGSGGLGGRRGASLVDGGAQKGGKGKAGGKPEKCGDGREDGGYQGWQPAGLESQALAVHLGQAGGGGGGGKKSRRAIILDTVAIVFHHLLDDTKREWIKQWAGELNLGGLSKPGHPGLVPTMRFRLMVKEKVYS